MLTSDYDFWIAIDEIAMFNAAVAECGFHPSVDPDQARRRGRYALDNNQHIDVLIARSVPTLEGVKVSFEDLWGRRRTIPVAPGIDVHLPMVDDLILTKRFADRPKDLEDIRLLRILASEPEHDK